MSARRTELQTALCRYATHTLTCVHMVRTFCEVSSKWIHWRETEVDVMMDIKDRYDKIVLNISHVTQAENKGKAFLEYTKNKVTQLTADRRRAELQKELDELLKDTLEGLEELLCFLDAVEMLAVTSLRVFTENRVLRLPEDVTLHYVQGVITAARLLCPLLLEFKRDANCFFLPKLQNVEVLSYQLNKYIQTTKVICEKFEESCCRDFGRTTTRETVVDLRADLSEGDLQRMLDHINQLREIRKDPHFRMVFMFQQEIAQRFVSEFNRRHSRMLQFLRDLEEAAVQLDKMNTGAKISGVAGSSVGAVGGVLSIAGLALIPVTAGVSLALTLAGIGLGVTSAANSAVTAATEMGVTATQQKKANEVFQRFMEDVQSLQDCVEEVISQTVSKLRATEAEVALGISKVIRKVGVVGRGIDSLAGSAAKSSIALSQSARAGFITLNALFLGTDIFFIYKNSSSLARGDKSLVSQFIRARAALWSSEVDSWEKIRDSLQEGLPTSEEKEAALETLFYLETKKQRWKSRQAPWMKN